MSRKNEEPKPTGSVSVRAPDFVGKDGVAYTDIEVIVEMDGEIRDAVQLVKTIEHQGAQRWSCPVLSSRGRSTNAP